MMIDLNMNKMLCALFLLMCSFDLHASDQELMWVAVTDNYSEYQVPMKRTLFKQLVSGQYKEEYLHLTNIYWFDEESTKVQQQMVTGKTWGYSNEAYVRTKYILRIMPLTKEHIDANGLTFK